MGIGSAEKVFLVRAAPVTVYVDVRTAVGKIGNVIESDDSGLFVRGTTRYGLQKVRLKCHVIAEGDSARVVVRAFADDIWSKGAREGIRKLQNQLGL